MIWFDFEFLERLEVFWEINGFNKAFIMFFRRLYVK